MTEQLKLTLSSFYVVRILIRFLLILYSLFDPASRASDGLLFNVPPDRLGRGNSSAFSVSAHYRIIMAGLRGKIYPANPLEMTTMMISI